MKCKNSTIVRDARSGGVSRRAVLAGVGVVAGLAALGARPNVPSRLDKPIIFTNVLDLHISESSVVTYRKRAYEKLGIATQNELFALCLDASQR